LEEGREREREERKTERRGIWDQKDSSIKNNQKVEQKQLWV